MDPKDDPEARIRELERPLADSARTSELGTGGYSGFPPPPPVPPGLPAQWPGYQPYPAPPQPRRNAGTMPLLILFGVLTATLVAGGIAASLMFSDTGSGKTETFTDSQSTTIRKTVVSPVPPPGPDASTQVPAGQTVIISGVGENRTLDCQDHTVIVSGIENRLEITGHCAAVTVSGVQNTISIESVDTIGVSGFENRVTFHTGQPDVSNSGQSNVVEQG
ncbi:DUF3060 domain-containing protein [Mycolicibacterium frederiksbergense]|nr:DUF3060 domain-containing protein [Mycolicibacterium frederiksbergense]